CRCAAGAIRPGQSGLRYPTLGRRDQVEPKGTDLCALRSRDPESPLSQGFELNGSACFHLLDQTKDLLPSPTRPDFLAQDFEPRQVDGLLAFVQRVSDHPLEVQDVLSSLSGIPGWCEHGSILICQSGL